MMMKDLEIHKDLESEELSAVRGGANTIVAGEYDHPLFGPELPDVEGLLKKIADAFQPPFHPYGQS